MGIHSQGCLELSQGLWSFINNDKAKLISDGGDSLEIKVIASLFGERIRCLAKGFKYLGCILKPNKYEIYDQEFLVTQFEMTFLRWDHRWLSLGGRLNMVSSIFQGTHVFQMHIFQIPNSIIKNIELLQKFFSGLNPVPIK